MSEDHEEEEEGASLGDEGRAVIIGAEEEDEDGATAFRDEQYGEGEPSLSMEGQHAGEAHDPEDEKEKEEEEVKELKEKEEEEEQQQEDKEQQQQQEERRRQQEHAHKAASRNNQEDPHPSLRLSGSAAEDAEAPLASVDDCVAALRALPGGDAALPQIADIVAEFHRSYVTVPGYHKHTSRKVSEWIRACKHALHRAWLQAAAAAAAAAYNTPSSSSSSYYYYASSSSSSPSYSPSSGAAPPPAAPRPPPFPSRRAGLAVESCIMSGIHDAVFGSVAKWAGPRDAELSSVMRWLQEEQQQGGGGGGGRGSSDEALRRVCGVPDRLLSADLGPAASLLASVPSCRCPLEMMCCLRGANHAILCAVADVSRIEERRRREERRLKLLEEEEMEEAEEAWGGRGGREEEEEEPRGRGEDEEELRQVSADELLPLFIASLAAARPPQAFSALEYLLTFHQEGDLHGHGGYMLAMLDASMQFLLQFHAKGLVNRQRLGAPAASSSSSSSFRSSASLQSPGPHHRSHGPRALSPSPSSWSPGAPEPPPGLSVHPVDDGPPADPRADSLPSLTLMGGDYSSIDRASKIFFNSIGKRHLGSGGAPADSSAAAAAAAAGGTAALGLRDMGLAAGAPSAPWDALQQGQRQQDPGAEEEVQEAAAAAAAVENQFPRLRIDLSVPQQQQDDPPLFPLSGRGGGGGSHQQQGTVDSSSGRKGPKSPRRSPGDAPLAPSAAAGGATRCSISSRGSSSSSTGGGGAPDLRQLWKQKQKPEEPAVTAPSSSSAAFRPPAIISARANAPENPSAGLGSFLSGLRSKGEAASGSSRTRL